MSRATSIDGLFGEQAIPGPPGAGPLAETLRVLLREARASGERQKAVLSHGLRLDVFPDSGAWGVALSREDVPPDALEVDIVAREAALPDYAEERTHHGGRHWIILRPPLPAGDASEPEDDDPPTDQLRALLLSPGPWRNALLSPAMQEAREAALRGMERAELRGEYAWAQRHWPGAAENVMNATPPPAG